MEKKTERYLVNRLEQLEKEVAQLKKDNSELIEALNIASNDSQKLRYVRRYFALDTTITDMAVIQVQKLDGSYVAHLCWQDDEDYEDLLKALDLKGEQ